MDAQFLRHKLFFVHTFGFQTSMVLDPPPYNLQNKQPLLVSSTLVDFVINLEELQCYCEGPFHHIFDGWISDLADPKANLTCYSLEHMHAHFLD